MQSVPFQMTDRYLTMEYNDTRGQSLSKIKVLRYYLNRTYPNVFCKLCTKIEAVNKIFCFNASFLVHNLQNTMGYLMLRLNSLVKPVSSTNIRILKGGKKLCLLLNSWHIHNHVFDFVVYMLIYMEFPHKVLTAVTIVGTPTYLHLFYPVLRFTSQLSILCPNTHPDTDPDYRCLTIMAPLVLPTLCPLHTRATLPLA
jgi:hypothetical protein